MFEDFYLDIELIGDVKQPVRGTAESAGIDFFSPCDIHIEPNSQVLIPLAVKVRFARGYVMMLKEKSSISSKNNVDIGASIIDSDYRGVIHAHLINNNFDKLIFFQKGIKIIQGIIVPIWLGKINIVKKIDDITGRNECGFGSTGER